jgi:hypothetical protein
MRLLDAARLGPLPAGLPLAALASRDSPARSRTFRPTSRFAFSFVPGAPPSHGPSRHRYVPLRLLCLAHVRGLRAEGSKISGDCGGWEGGE